MLLDPDICQIERRSADQDGCIVLYRSTDLVKWNYYGPIYEPYHTNCPECCEMYKIGDVWYLSYSRFSEFVNTIYRVSDSPFGPWRTPVMDGIGGRRFYAAKSCVKMRADVSILHGHMTVQRERIPANGIGAVHSVSLMRWCRTKMENWM